MKYCKIRIFIKASFSLLLLLVFAWWAYQATAKYFNQPISTQITYTLGDDGSIIKFPHLTICRDLSFKDFLPCGNGSRRFLDTILNCLNSPDNKLSLDEMVKILDSKRSDLVHNVSIIESGGPILATFDERHDSVWNKVYNRFNGICHTLEIEQGFDVREVSPWLQMIKTKKENWESLVIRLHSHDDLADAGRINPEVYVGDDKIEFLDCFIKKTIIKRESTRKYPCGKFQQKTFEEIEEYQMVLDNFGCHIPILYSGRHLDNLLMEKLPKCSDSETKEALNMIKNREKSKESQESCLKTKYSMMLDTIEYRGNGTFENDISFKFMQMEVEHHETYVNYDFQSLVGEVGGVLGLTLGLSGLSMIDYFTNWIFSLFSK